MGGLRQDFVSSIAANVFGMHDVRENRPTMHCGLGGILVPSAKCVSQTHPSHLDSSHSSIKKKKLHEILIAGLENGGPACSTWSHPSSSANKNALKGGGRKMASCYWLGSEAAAALRSGPGSAWWWTHTHAPRETNTTIWKSMENDAIHVQPKFNIICVCRTLLPCGLAF